MKITLNIENQELYDNIVKEANNSFRTINLQIQYILSSWLLNSLNNEEIAPVIKEPEVYRDKPMSREEFERAGLIDRTSE